MMTWKHLWRDGAPNTDCFCAGMSFDNASGKLKMGFFLFNDHTRRWSAIYQHAAQYVDPPIYYCEIPQFSTQKGNTKK